MISTTRASTKHLPPTQPLRRAVKDPPQDNWRQSSVIVPASVPLRSANNLVADPKPQAGLLHAGSLVGSPADVEGVGEVVEKRRPGSDLRLQRRGERQQLGQEESGGGGAPGVGSGNGDNVLTGHQPSPDSRG